MENEAAAQTGRPTTAITTERQIVMEKIAVEPVSNADAARSSNWRYGAARAALSRDSRPRSRGARITPVGEAKSTDQQDRKSVV